MAQTKIRQSQIVNDGWVPFPSGVTCTYQGADDPTYTMYVSGEAQTFLSIGMKFECFQSGMKFFFITAIGAYDSGNDRTLVTLYGGTDYDLANAEVGIPAYSMVKSPYGFPMSPLKWSVITTDTTSRSQSNPTQNTWYNLGSVSASVPIGSWNLGYKVNVQGYKEGTTQMICQTTLSTANNSESDADYSAYIVQDGASGNQVVASPVYVEKYVDIAAKTSYYLNTRTFTGGTISNIYNNGYHRPILIYAECAYL